MEDDTPWTIPILLDFENKVANEGEIIVLTNKENNVRALLNIEEVYKYDKKIIAEKVQREKEERFSLAGRYLDLSRSKKKISIE